MSKSSNDDLASYAYYHFTAGKAAQSIVYTVFGFATVHYLMQSALPDWLAKGIWILEFVLLLFQGIHFINALKEMDEAVGDKKYLYYVCFHDSLIFLSPTLLFVFLTLLFKWPSMPVWMIVLSVLDVLATAIIEFTFIGTVRQSEEIKKSKTKKRG